MKLAATLTTHTPEAQTGTVDGSKQSLSALHLAVDEARLRHGQLRVFTAWQYPPVPSTVEDSGLSGSLPVAEGIQSDALQTVNAEGVQIETVTVRSLPAEALLDASQDADLVVVGSRGHVGFASLLLGLVSSQIAHPASCPVLIVRPRTGI